MVDSRILPARAGQGHSLLGHLEVEEEVPPERRGTEGITMKCSILSNEGLRRTPERSVASLDQPNTKQRTEGGTG